MIDGLHFEVPKEAIKNNDVLEFHSYGNGLRAKYKGLTLRGGNNPTYSVNGSIHKYFNDGEHNYNDFTLSNFIASIEDIGKVLNVDPGVVRVGRVEIGVNLDVDVDVNKFISYILLYSNIVPTMTSQGIVFQLDAYDVKVYSKKVKGYNDRLRFEIAIKKKRKRNAIIKEYAPYCNTLDDLTNSNIWRAFSSELTKVFEDIVIVDKDSIDYSNLSAKESELLTKGVNPFHWTQDWSNRQTRANHLERFLKIVESKSNNNIKEQVRKALSSKLDQLIDVDNIPSYQLHNPNLLDAESLTFAPKMKDEEKDKILSFALVDKVGNRQSSNSSILCCEITSLSLEIEVEQGSYLSAKGVEYYYLNERELFDKYLYPRLSDRWKDKALNIQFREIAHSIRNERYNPKNNPRNNLKRDIKNVLSKSSGLLFSIESTICESKRELYVELIS